jgi:hypothetical protein
MAVTVERKGGCRARPCKLQCKLRTKVYHDLALLSPSVLFYPVTRTNHVDRIVYE